MSVTILEATEFTVILMNILMTIPVSLNKFMMLVLLFNTLLNWFSTIFFRIAMVKMSISHPLINRVTIFLETIFQSNYTYYLEKQT